MAHCIPHLGTDQNPEDIARWIFGPDGVHILLRTKSAAYVNAINIRREAAHLEIHHKHGGPCEEYRKVSPTQVDP